MMTSSFITCYRRLFVDIPPFLVISPNLAKYFNVYDLEKNGVLHVKLTFETTLILYMNAEAIFSVIF